MAAALAAAGGVAVFAVAIPWLRRLPRRTARLLILAGAVYFGGAFGLEIAGRMLETRGVDEGVVEALPSIEELAEMTGSACWSTRSGRAPPGAEPGPLSIRAIPLTNV